MTIETRSKIERINRRGWWLWAGTVAVMLALTATVPLLYFPMLDLGRQLIGSTEPIETSYPSMIGLAGLIVVFLFYSALRHRELNSMRRALMEEEQATEDVRTRLSELSALFQMSTSLNLQFRLETVLEIIVRRVVSALHAQQASIMIYNPETGVLETRATYGLEAEFARNSRLRMGEGIAGWVAQRNQGLLLGPKPADHELGLHFKADRNISSSLSLPLRFGDRCIGVLNVNRINHPDPFQEHHRDMLSMFAEHIGAVIERAETLQRLGARSKLLEEANVRLTEMNSMKDMFLSTASHELKTPLTSVIAYAELLAESEAKLSRDQHDEFLRRLRGEAGRLLALIEDILDLSRLESGKLTLKRVPLSVNEIAHAAIETARSMAGQQRIELHEEYENGLPEIPIDEVKMRQVFVNLIVNAIKFSPARADVTIQTIREPQFLRIEVRDHGPGIEPDEATHIFELFGQGVPGKEAQSPGLGIGLHLVKRITELHGGHVGVNSIPGQGSRFWVRLPLALAEVAPVAAEAEERRAAA